MPSPPLSKGGDSIQVAIRVRPFNQKEATSGRAWRVISEENSICQVAEGGDGGTTKHQTHFTFDKTFGEDTTTEDVYDGIARDIVEKFVTGHNGTLFAYGQTSSGKTHTMQGASGDALKKSRNDSVDGIVQMAARDIFAHIGNEPTREFLIRASFIEIYNEEVRDLIPLSGVEGDGNTGVLAIHESKKRGVFVDCNETIVTDADALVETLLLGQKNRVVASTDMNSRSSRSHTIFRITVESRENAVGQACGESDSDSDGAVLISTLNLVDLAGSESVRHTGATGKRQKEGGKINQSLLTLARVIEGLGKKKKVHINFRDSKLTRILQPSLSGNSRIAIVCCASPSSSYIEETRSTLKFASRAKLVKTKAKKNEVMDDRSLIKRLQKELAEARRALAEKEEKLKNQDALSDSAHVKEEAATKAAEARLEGLRSMILPGGISDLTQPNKTLTPPRSSNYPRSATLTPAALSAALSENFVESDEEDQASMKDGNGRYSRKNDLRSSVAVLHFDHSDAVLSMFENHSKDVNIEEDSGMNKHMAAKNLGKPQGRTSLEVDLLKEALKAEESLVEELRSKLSDTEKQLESTRNDLHCAEDTMKSLTCERDDALARLNDLVKGNESSVNANRETTDDGDQRSDERRWKQAINQVRFIVNHVTEWFAMRTSPVRTAQAVTSNGQKPKLS